MYENNVYVTRPLVPRLGVVSHMLVLQLWAVQPSRITLAFVHASNVIVNGVPWCP